MEKRLSDITRAEWIGIRWMEADQAMGDDERIFIDNGKRTPDEAAQAQIDWDDTEEARSEVAIDMTEAQEA